MYDLTAFEEDGKKTARALHATYRRCTFLLDRWNNGVSATVPNSGGGVKVWDFMARAQELVTNFEANAGVKLNHVLTYSDLTLPGD